MIYKLTEDEEWSGVQTSVDSDYILYAFTNQAW